MLLPPLKTKLSANVDSIETPFRTPGNAAELARLRRLEDLRANMNDLRPSLAAVPPRPVSYGQLVQSPSAPTLHDFSTKTHLARLDLAYERLDAHVEQCMQQMMTALSEQRQSMEEWLQERLTLVSRRIASQNDSECHSLEVRSLSPQDPEIWKKLASLEERLGRCAGTDPTTLSRISAVEDRVKVCPLLEAEVRACQERLAARAGVEADLHNRIAAFEALVGGRSDVTSAIGDVGARLLDLEKKFAQAPTRDVMLETRVADLEQQSSAVSSTCCELRTAFETAIGDLARELSDHIIAKDMKFKVLETRIDGLQGAAADLATQMESDRTTAASMIQEQAKDPASLEKQASVIDSINDRISQALASGATTSMEKQLSVIDERISSALESEPITSLQARVADLKEQLESRLTERLETVEKNISGCVDTLQSALDELSRQLQANGEQGLSPVKVRSYSEQVRPSACGQPTSASSIAEIYAQDVSEADQRQSQVSKHVITKSIPEEQVEITRNPIEDDVTEQRSSHSLAVDKPEQIATNELRNARVQALVEEGKLTYSENTKDRREASEQIEVVKSELRAERPVTAPFEHSEFQHPKSLERNHGLKASIDDDVSKETALHDDVKTEATHVYSYTPSRKEVSHVESQQMSVLTSLDQTAMRIEDRVSSLDSRLQLAVNVIEANKVESDQKFNSMETRMHQIATKPEYDDLARRLQAIETDGGTSQQSKVTTAMTSRVVRRVESSSVGSPSFVSSPVALQDTDKRTVAAAMVMMEQKLEGYVTKNDFNDLREHMQDGLENIGERIRSAHESQMQKTESMLTHLLETRRQRSRGGKRAKDQLHESENDNTQPNSEPSAVSGS